MKYLILLFFLITYSGYSQDDSINNLFFTIPLNESRESIYDFVANSSLFINEENGAKLTRKGKEIKVYSGYLNRLSPELIKTKVDSVEIQLSSGSVSREGEKETKDLLIFWSYYYLSDSKLAERHYKQLKKQISKICNETPYHFTEFRKEENDIKEKQIGFSDKWYFKNEVNLEIELKFEILKEDEKYQVQIGYSRYE